VHGSSTCGQGLSERPGPGSNAYWPEADAVGGIWGILPGTKFDGWLVLGVPPEPFVFRDANDFSWPRAQYGPAGTVWAFTAAQILDRASGVPVSKLAIIVRAILRKLGRIPGSVVPFFWVIPNDYTPREKLMRWILTTVHGKVGADEEVAHTFKWRHTTVENGPLSGAELQAFAALVRDRWEAFLTAGPGSVQPNDLLAGTLRYNEVRAAYLEQTAEFQPRPNYIIPTVYAPFAPGTGIGQGVQNPLPYEVSCCISLNTNFRGPRFRGRSYLGPLDQSIMAADGLFDNGATGLIGQRFWNAFVMGVTDNSDFELHVVSQKWNTSAAVIGCRTGVVPDSQRRRRKSQKELYAQTGGVPMGTYALGA